MSEESKIDNSLENYKMFLKDDTIEIDYTYLWDIVCTPNKYLFPEGLNIILMEIIETDSTNNVGLVCPSNIFSRETFHEDRPIVFIMKKGNYYEPLYANIRNNKQEKTIKLFEYKDVKSLGMESLFKTLRNLLDSCKPIPFRKIHTTTPLYLYQLKEISEEHSIPIVAQVVHPNNKVIALEMKYKDNILYIPCRSSSQEDGIKITEMHAIHTEEYLNYNDAIQLYNELHRLYQIPCRPIRKVVEDGVIVGLLVETNQFIPIRIDDSIVVVNDGIDIIESMNYLTQDLNIFNETQKDEERRESIHSIYLETQFYNAYRNTYRMFLHKMENFDKKQELIEILENTQDTYIAKKEQLKQHISTIIGEVIDFVEIDREILMSMQHVSHCNSSTCSSSPNCMYDEGSCTLLIPKSNMIHGNANQEIYESRLSDELIRYHHLRQYILNPSSFLVFDDSPIQVRDNEMIVTEAMIDDKFFDTKKQTYNSYIQQQAFEFLQPKEKFNEIYQFRDNEKQKEYIQKEENSLMDEEQEEKDSNNQEEEKKEIKIELDETHIENRGPIVGKKWKGIFKDGFIQVQMENKPETTFYIIQHILQAVKGKILSIEELKEELILEYTKQFMRSPEDNQIISILKDQGKHKMFNQKDSPDLNTLIRSPAYYLTNLDIMLFAKKYNLPIVLFTSASSGMMELKNEEYNKMWITGTREILQMEHFIFIRQPGIKRDVPPMYSLITYDNSVVIHESKLSDVLRENLSVYTRRPTFEDFIDNYKKNKNLQSLQVV